MSSMLEKKTEDGVPQMEDSNMEPAMSTIIGTTEQTEGDALMEKRAWRKFDKFLLPQMALVIILAYLDRTNIGRLPKCPRTALSS